MGHSQLFAVRIRRSANVAIATDDLDIDRAAIATAAGALERIDSLFQRHQRGRIALAGYIQSGILLECFQGELGAVAEVTIAAPRAEIIPQLQQHLLHQIHVLALAAVSQDAVAQSIGFGLRYRCFPATCAQKYVGEDRRKHTRKNHSNLFRD